MANQLDDDNDDGLGCFKFQLYLDDLNEGANRKKHPFNSACHHKEDRFQALTNTDLKRSQFEYSPSPTPDSRAQAESSFRRVYDLINEQEPDMTSDKKNKKGTKNLTPETNYTQKDSKQEDDTNSLSCREHRREFNMWGSYRMSRDEDTTSKRALTAFSEAFEPDNLSLCNEKNEAGLVFDLEGLRLSRLPKKHSMVGDETTINLFQALRPNPRKLSFQQVRRMEMPLNVSSRFNPSPTRKPNETRLSALVKPRLDVLLDLIGQRVNSQLSKQPLADFPSLSSN